jgi:outer membrane immunogenic protein
MKKLLLAVAGMLAVAAVDSAGAADLAMPVKAPPPPPVFDWSGFYIGGHVGYGWDTSTFTSNNAFGVQEFGPVNFDASGLFAGGQIGYNWVVGPHSWVVGFEADGSWADVKGSLTDCVALATRGCGQNDMTIDAFGTVRARVGYHWDNFLIYGTGGWAWAHSGTDRTITCVGAGCPGVTVPGAPLGAVASSDDFQNGWAAGAGFEWGFNPNWTLGVEYIHLEFDDPGRDFSYPGFNL